MEPDEPLLKRRKVRKGTRSCWECKGRKAKCTYATPEDTICDGCIRRGTKCVSQELPEQPLGTVDRRRQIGNRMVRVEALIDRLVKNNGTGPMTPDEDTETSQNSESNSSWPASVLVQAPNNARQSDSPRGTGLRNSTIDSPDTLVNENFEASGSTKSEKISRDLLSIYPSQEMIDIIVRTAGPMPSFFHQLLARKPYKDIKITEQQELEQMAELNIRHTQWTHPLIIARQMLLLAISFRYIHPSVHSEFKNGPESPDITMKRLAGAAIDLITTNDSLINNLEGLECLLLASSFQADTGNLRAALSITRRAMLTAQLMSLHRRKRPALVSVQANSQWNPELLWSRIVYFDRFFSLILGLPQGSTDTSMGSAPPPEDDMPLDRLERGHCVLASRILRRNDNDSNVGSLIDIQAIDKEFRKLAESMPSKWWLVPNLASIQDPDQLFWATMRLTSQIFHYILLSHLHLPFMLQPLAEFGDHEHEYSRSACVNASRDLLQRYMSLRTFNHGSYACHSMDFFAITASMTLVLAHLSSHGSKRHSDTGLVHQRLADRAIMEEILDNMTQVGTLNKTKTISERGAGVLRQLLAIESDAARGSPYHVESGDCHPDDARALRLTIPYFGTITITQAVAATQQEPGASYAFASRASEYVTPNTELTRASTHETASVEGLKDKHVGTNPISLGQDGPPSKAPPANASSYSPAISIADNALPTFVQPTNSLAYLQSFDPALPVNQEDWVLGDVDMSIFDTLLAESDARGESNGDYWWLM